MQRPKIKSNLVRITLLPHCSIRVTGGSEAHTAHDSHACLVAAEKVLLLWQLKQAEDWCHPEFRRVIWSWEDVKAYYLCFPKLSWKVLLGMWSTQSQLACPAQPLSPDSLASCSCLSDISDSRPAAWMRAHCCSCTFGLL